MAHLGDEIPVSMCVHASIDMTGTEVTRVWHVVCLYPADRTWIGDQDFILVELMTLVLSSDFCTLFQMLSCLPDIYNKVKSDSKTKS